MFPFVHALVPELMCFLLFVDFFPQIKDHVFNVINVISSHYYATFYAKVLRNFKNTEFNFWFNSSGCSFGTITSSLMTALKLYNFPFCVFLTVNSTYIPFRNRLDRFGL
jgi:hypothetical protein